MFPKNFKKFVRVQNLILKSPESTNNLCILYIIFRPYRNKYLCCIETFVNICIINNIINIYIIQMFVMKNDILVCIRIHNLGIVRYVYIHF